MPKMNGIEATKVIRKMSSYFPIMALTANDNYKKECLAVGMDDFIVKPCLPDSLFSKISELTVKSITWMLNNNRPVLKEEMPMDAKHAKELIELRKKGLTKLCIHGNGGEFTFIVDERVQNKISYDLVGKKQEISEFLDRSEQKPGLCHLYKGNFMVNTKYLLPEEFEEHKLEEESVLIECNKTLKPLDD